MKKLLTTWLFLATGAIAHSQNYWISHTTQNFPWETWVSHAKSNEESLLDPKADERTYFIHAWVVNALVIEWGERPASLYAWEINYNLNLWQRLWEHPVVLELWVLTDWDGNAPVVGLHEGILELKGTEISLVQEVVIHPQEEPTVNVHWTTDWDGHWMPWDKPHTSSDHKINFELWIMGSSELKVLWVSTEIFVVFSYSPAGNSKGVVFGLGIPLR